MGARITAAIAALAVIALLAGAIGGGARASGGSITNVTEPNGGTVVLQGGEWNVYAPSNHSTGTNGSATPYTNNGDWVSIFGDTPQPSGSTHTSVPFGAGGVLIVCPPGSASAGASGCHTSGSLGMNKTSTNDPELAMVYFDGQQFPSFCWCETSGYATTVDGNTPSVTVSATPQDSNGASFTVNGASGQQVVNLNPPGQDTTITVTGVANNTTSTENYSFTVHRGLSNADLSGLSISPGSISGFSSGTTDYSTNVLKATTQVTVTPTLSADDASYQLQVGGDPASNPVTLADSGPTQIDVVVTAGDGTTTKTYSVTVTRGLTDADLSALTISPGSIDFDGSTAYSASVPSTTTQVTVTPTLDDTSDGTAASYQLKIGSNVVENPITLNATDPTNIDVVVTADDGTTTKTYSIAVSHLASIGLHVTFTGKGKGSVTSLEPDNAVSCSTTSPKAASCTVVYDQGTTVVLGETTASGSFFNGWSGDCSGGDTSTEFTMPSSTATCTADFESLGAKQSGTSFKVTSGDDDPGADDPTCYVARCTLRDALASAPSGATITFANTASNVALTQGLTFDTGKTVTLDGGGDVVLDGSDISSRSLDVTSGKLTIRNMSVNGNEEYGALADETGTTLSLTNVGVYDNGAEFGGGIYSAGTLTMTGGGLAFDGSDNGGGLYVSAGTATLTSVELYENFGFDSGGNIVVDQNGKLTMSGGYVDSGESFGDGGGILVAGTAVFTNTVIGGNEGSTGAGVYVAGSGAATFSNATLIGNEGDWALSADSTATAKLVNSTIAFNDSGGARGIGVRFLNTLLAENNGGNCDSSHLPGSLGHNVVDDSTCWSSDTNGDKTVDDAHLAEPTEDGFVPLDYDSPALDAGTKAGTGGLTVPTKDARGIARPQGAGIDVGALEMQVHKLTVKVAGPGKGTVTPSGSYVAGATIPVVATPADGSAFGGWSGACSGTELEYDLVLNADATCTATFAKPPAITSFSPASSRIRSTVTIVGSGFTGATAVTFGDTNAESFKVVSDTKITAVVPDDAPDSGAITVTNPADSASSANPWTLVWVAPKVTSFTPAKAGGTAPVTITGTGFFGATDVDFNGDSVGEDGFVVVSDTKITTTVPVDATTGPIHVTTPGGVAASRSSFTFIPPPTITDWSGGDADLPHSAPVGGTITITGTNLTGVTAVKINNVAAKFKYVNVTTVTAVVPDLATNGPITLTTPGGTTLSGAAYTQSWIVPTVTSVTPATGPIRTKVTIVGTHFRGATELSFGGHDAVTWSIVSDTKITATVPDSAETGVVQVTNPAGGSTSTKSFKVTWPKPKITSFTPSSGAVDATVTITGTGLLGATGVQLNGMDCEYTVLSATKVTFTVPEGATTGTIKVITPGGTATSTKKFTVISTP